MRAIRDAPALAEHSGQLALGLDFQKKEGI